MTSSETNSLIIPYFNNISTIERCINSARNQARPFEQIIIVDDGSAIPLGDSLKLRKNESLLRQSNKGVSSARNLGTAHVDTLYVTFLDADDYLDPDYNLEVSHVIDEFNPDAVATGYTIHARKKTHSVSFPEYSNNPGFFITNYFEMANKKMTPLTASNTCIRRSVLLELGGFPVGWKLGEDQKVWIALNLNKKVYFINKILSHYDKTFELSATKTNRIKFVLPHIRYVEELIASQPELFNPDVLRSACNFIARGYLFYLKNAPDCSQKDALNSSIGAIQYSRGIKEYFGSLLFMIIGLLPAKFRRKVYRFLNR